MPLRVKICGLKTRETMAVALDAGADFVGLVFFPKSPRHVTDSAAIELAEQARGIAEVVALTVDADDARLEQILRAANPDVIQVHGKESPERVAAIRRLTGKPVIKAVAVATAADAAAALAYRGVADIILFDAKAPADAVLPGGNGVTFDWRHLDGVKDRLPWMLSGGLTADTVAAAIRISGATMVDVSSGVESSPGVKDALKIQQFIQAARGAN
jgi:phosphoribosylanthranilate isomerase